MFIFGRQIKLIIIKKCMETKNNLFFKLNSKFSKNYKIKSLKKFSILFFFLAISFSGFSQNRNSSFEEYIRTYKDWAIYHMNKYKIPASITLAQAILESGAGTSHLAIYANNHFGIKNKPEWKGEVITNPNDGELYRKYDSVQKSYNDHSLFLTQRSWYKPLFQLDILDYRAWAIGLQKAGYAVDKEYPQKLIRIIETYRLYLYDHELVANQ